MIKGEIKIGDILYDQISDEIIEVTRFGEDQFGQAAIEYQNKIITKYTTAYLIFRYFIIRHTMIYK